MNPQEITVIIVARNAEGTIWRALSSAQQAGAVNVLVVDDASEDRTVAEILAFSGLPVDLIRKPLHTTLGSARELAIQSVRTPYWMGLDADDELLPDRIGQCLEAFESGFQVYLDGAELCNEASDSVRLAPIPAFLEGASLCRLFERNYLPVTGPIAMETDLSRQVGYDPQFETAEDYDFLLRLLMLRPRIFLNPTCAYRIHERASSVSHQLRKQRDFVKKALQRHRYETIQAELMHAGFDGNRMSWILCSMAIFREDWMRAELFLQDAWGSGLMGDGILEPEGPYLFPESWRYHYTRSVLRMKQEDFASARSHLEQALIIRRSPETLNNLGVAISHLGACDAGRKLILEALDQFPGYWDAKRNIDGAGMPIHITTHPFRISFVRQTYGVCEHSPSTVDDRGETVLPAPKRMLFLDRDGTLIKEKHYLCDPDEVELCENAVPGLLAFQSMGFHMVVVTNQSGIGRGYYSEEEMKVVNERIESILESHGIQLSQFLHCPHSPESECDCRKPKTGMLSNLSKTLGRPWDLSVMIGDKACDIGFARNAEMIAILVKTGYGEHYDFINDLNPDHMVSDLWEAAKWIKQQPS